MKAIEWWPTAPDRNGFIQPRVWISGPCAECGTNVTRRTVPYMPESTEACSPSCRKKISRAQKKAGTLPPEERPKPWLRPAEFDAWLAGGFDGLYQYRSERDKADPNTPKKIRSMSVERRKQAVKSAGLAVVKRWKVGDFDDAKRVIGLYPPELTDDILRFAAARIDPKTTPSAKLKPAPAPTTPEPALKGAPLKRPKMKQQTRAQRIASYRAYRAQVSKSSDPITDEYRRRLMCPRPDKVAYEYTAVGWEAADWHVTELRNAAGGENVSAYVCEGCGFIHVGNTFQPVVKAASWKVS